jgi:hypothetical protein
MKKLFWLILAITLLAAFIALSHANYECMKMGTLQAIFTVNGVICTYEVKGFQKFIPLEDLHLQYEKRLQFEACLKLHQDQKFFCEPGYQAPIPHLKIERG